VSYKNKKSKKLYPKKALVILAVLILTGFLVLVLEKTGVINLYERNTNNLPEAQQDAINYGPATEEEKNAAEDNKQRLTIEQQQNQTQPQQPTGDQKISVTPVFGYIEISESQINSNGFITTMIEEGGTCTLTLKKDGVTKQTSNTSLADAQSTVCGLMQISTDGLSIGNWTATISYSSDKYEGVSEERLVKVE
jgi:hypothetical protein